MLINNERVVKFSERANKIQTFLAMEYSEKAGELERNGHKVIKLNLGEPDFGPPEIVKREMINAIQDNKVDYTSALGISELREATSHFYKDQYELSINPNRVVITAGASASLLLLCAALLEQGDKVMISDPSYPCNKEFIRAFGGATVAVECDAGVNFQLSYNKVLEHYTTDLKGILIASPSNPTGTCICPKELEKISAFCQKNSLWMIIDEIYLNLVYDNINTQTALAINDNAIVINSFSKYFGMTGWRLGWCIVPENMTETMSKLAQNLYICPSTPTQYAAVHSFSEDALQECENRKATLTTNKNLVIQHFQSSVLSIDATPQGAFYAYINISRTKLNAVDFCEELLEEFFVALTPGNDFGEHKADQYVRLSFATNTDDLKEGLQRIDQYINQLKLKAY